MENKKDEKKEELKEEQLKDVSGGYIPYTWDEVEIPQQNDDLFPGGNPIDLPGPTK